VSGQRGQCWQGPCESWEQLLSKIWAWKGHPERIPTLTWPQPEAASSETVEMAGWVTMQLEGHHMV
jgi:hypothetical protein